MDKIDFKALWLKQVVSEPDMEDLFLKLKKFKRSSLLKLILTNVLLIATTIAIGLIWYYAQPSYVSTKLGITLIIESILVFLFVYNKQLPGFTKIDATQSNSSYLQNLIALKNKQHFIHTKMLSLYFLMLSIGICLYMIEYTVRMTLIQGVLVYTTTLLWLGFNWFYLRPKTIKKQKTKLNQLIHKFESSKKQLNELD